MKNHKSKVFTWSTRVVYLLVILVIVDYLFVGNIAYALKYRDCGTRPVLVVNTGQGLGFGTSRDEYAAYTNPSFFSVKNPRLGVFLEGKRALFCNLEEVKKSYGTSFTVQ